MPSDIINNEIENTTRFRTKRAAKERCVEKKRIDDELSYESESQE